MSDPAWLRLNNRIDMTQYDVVRITLRAEVYYKSSDYHVWMMTGLTENITVNYFAPKELEFSFAPNHPNESQLRLSSDGMTHSCEFKGGILPYQGVTVSWAKRKVVNRVIKDNK